jgi:hypothetical protein
MGQVLTTITVTNRIDLVMAERGFMGADNAYGIYENITFPLIFQVFKLLFF